MAIEQLFPSQSLCEALGLNHEYVRSIELREYENELPEIVVKFVVTREDADGLKRHNAPKMLEGVRSEHDSNTHYAIG